MRQNRDQQPLSYDVRLPDEAQADALRLLEASRSVVNTLLTHLWPCLDEFGGEHPGPAWKQVVSMTASPDPHGDRQFRCEAETAGRILRAQAERKQIFLLIQPILSDGFISPKTENALRERIASASKKPSMHSPRRCVNSKLRGLALLPHRMWWNKLVIIFSPTVSFPLRMKRCKPFRCSRWGC